MSADDRLNHTMNKDLGIVGIPVERAIELLAQRGLPAREETNSAQ